MHAFVHEGMHASVHTHLHTHTSTSTHTQETHFNHIAGRATLRTPTSTETILFTAHTLFTTRATHISATLRTPTSTETLLVTCAGPSGDLRGYLRFQHAHYPVGSGAVRVGTRAHAHTHTHTHTQHVCMVCVYKVKRAAAAAVDRASAHDINTDAAAAAWIYRRG